jgi:NAD(P)-dependent dehydrogenase (short-subunit alcohol dehydrogenase family)
MKDMPLDFTLTDKVALVTGASRGIGRALALGLAQAGAQVILTGRDEEALRTVAEAITAPLALPVVLPLDVTKTDALTSQLDQAVATTGGLDILINNAGFESVCPSLEVTQQLWDSIVDTNLKGAFFMAQAAARIMRRGQGGAMVNLCSLSSSVGIPTAVAYTSSKSGLLGMTRALAAEWAGHGIRVNAIAPGYFRTDMTEVFFQNETWAKAMLERIPLGRFGTMSDLVGATVFLAGPAASYITGQMLTIDGGYLASI